MNLKKSVILVLIFLNMNVFSQDEPIVEYPSNTSSAMTLHTVGVNIQYNRLKEGFLEVGLAKTQAKGVFMIKYGAGVEYSFANEIKGIKGHLVFSRFWLNGGVDARYNVKEGMQTFSLMPHLGVGLFSYFSFYAGYNFSLTNEQIVGDLKEYVFGFQGYVPIFSFNRTNEEFTTF